MIAKMLFLVASYFSGLNSENPIVITVAIAYLAIGGLAFSVMGFAGSSGILAGLVGIAMLAGALHVFFHHRF